MKDDTYWGWALITGVLVFFGVWIYALSQWGFLFGIMFGWIPAIIAGVIAGALWPLVAIVVGLLILLVLSL